MIIKNEIDTIFKLYQYQVVDEDKDFWVYLHDIGMYAGAEIIPINPSLSDQDIESKVKEYQELGYNARIYHFTSKEDLEKYLFNGFFQVRNANNKNGRKYKQYIKNILSPYSDDGKQSFIGVKYEYVNISFRKERDFEIEHDTGSLIKSLLNEMNSSGAKLILVEAPAGFGKTSTAFEVLNSYTDYTKDIRPFFMELSKDRGASTFIYLLLNQIDKNFDSNLKSEVVIHNIKEGRIPLIIDGFDELLSRDIDNGVENSNFADVESMLSTLARLLSDQTKILLTSRRTAIFSGATFFEWHSFQKSNGRDFEIIRYQLNDPSIQDWLSPNRRKLLPNELVSLNNPVLLTYLKYAPEESLQGITSTNQLLNKYFEYLLKREIKRQALPLKNDEQLDIFNKLAAYYAGYEVTALKRKEVQDAFEELSRSLLLSKISSDKELAQLTNKLTNHALLDRKENNLDRVGFLNELIFGYLLALSFIQDSTEELKDYHSSLSFSFMQKAIEGGLYMKPDEKADLAKEMFKRTASTPIVDFMIDHLLLSRTTHNYKLQTFSHIVISDATFASNNVFENCTFSNLVFINCQFNFNNFKECQFIKCSFRDCAEIKESENYFYDCSGITIENREDEVDPQTEETEDWRIKFLSKFFKADGQTTKGIRITKLKEEIDEKLLNKRLSNLESAGLIKIYGDRTYINANGLNYLKNHRNG